ncbi:UDP-glucose 4-epimerase family protein [Vibrio sp. WJH972]
MKVLVTGCNGFVGNRLAEIAKENDHLVLQHQRRAADTADLHCEIDADTNWMLTGLNIDCVVHCAARVHQMNETVEEAKSEYQRVNVDGTLNLARQAAQAGLKRFVFISSIKVNGEFTLIDKPFTEEVEHSPEDLYGLSKYNAELGLRDIARDTGLEVVIIRPPLVYGPGVKANFAAMINGLKKGMPLPFGAINNQRSLVYLDNLIDFILCCSHHPKAAGETFLISDGSDVSTTQLLQAVTFELGKPSRLIPVPERWLESLLTLVGKKAISQRLLGSLQLDITKARQLLEWNAPVSFEDGIKKTVAAHISGEKRD